MRVSLCETHSRATPSNHWGQDALAVGGEGEEGVASYEEVDEVAVVGAFPREDLAAVH
jgi:hypothetical protein